MPRTRPGLLAALGTATLLAACDGAGTGASPTAHASYAPIPAGPIKVGFIAPLTGPNSQSGQFLLPSYSLFIKDVNDAGGIDGHQVTLVQGDDKADPSTGAAEARRLIETEHVAVFLEPGTGETTNEIMPILGRARVPVVAILPENQLDRPDKYPYYFSVYPSNSNSAAEIVKYAQVLGITKLGIARDTTGLGDPYEPVIRSEASSSGLTVTGTQKLDRDAADVTSDIRALRDQGADGLVILSAGAVVSRVYEALRAINWTPRIVGTYALLYSGTTSLGSLASSTFFSCGIGLKEGTAPDPGLDSAVKEANANLGRHSTNAGTVWAKDSLYILKAAIEKNHSLDPDGIKAAIESFRGVHYVSPDVTYSFSSAEHNGWPRQEVKMCRLDKVGPDGIPVFAPHS